MSKKIETPEQYKKALDWMVEMANHPLDPVNKDEKTRKIYGVVSAQVQEFNKTLYAGSEYPPLKEEEPPQDPVKPNLSGWLD